MQGSGTFAIEAALSSFVPRSGRALVVINGAYGHRAARILEILGRDHVTLDMGETRAPLGADVAAALENDPAITDVFVVHCETTTGILNPMADIARAARGAGKRLIIDSMSAFGALPLEVADVPFDVMVSSANKCIEGVPGFAFAIAGKALLEGAKGRSHSLCLDLHAQWRGLNSNGQFRFTPPTHAIMAFHRALELHEKEGGVAGRGRRYSENFRVLVDGMRALGFETLLDDDWMAPIIVTFVQPADPKFEMGRFYDEIRARGFAIYPGKLTAAETFRIGCIGQLDTGVMKAALAAIRDALDVMGVKNCAPAAS
jgi:2-aminoethylphosphonate-pyruvate transaminase